MRLLTDPLLRNRVGPLLRDVGTPDSSFRRVDAVLISHLHWDRLDLSSLRSLGGDTHPVVPKGEAVFLDRHGLHQVDEITPGEQTGIGKVMVEATQASHSGRRLPFGPTVEASVS